MDLIRVRDYQDECTRSELRDYWTFPAPNKTTAMEASIIICTYNRAAYLKDALLSLVTAPGGEPKAVEIVVVDNNCTDATQEVINTIAATSPIPIRTVKELRQGLSYARNLGAKTAQGRFVAYMDDDQIADSSYVATLLRHCRSTSAACFGGKIRFLDYEQAPAWLRLQTRYIGQLDCGDEPIRISKDTRKLKGGNFVIRRDVLEFIGGFDPNLGAKGSSFFAGEEDAVQNELLRRGYSIFYYPDLVQWNRYTADQRNKSYWRRRIFQHGRSKYRLQPELWTGRRTILGAPGWLYVSLARRLGKYALSLPRSDEAERFSREMDVWEMLGVIREAQRSRLPVQR